MSLAGLELVACEAQTTCQSLNAHTAYQPGLRVCVSVLGMEKWREGASMGSVTGTVTSLAGAEVTPICDSKHSLSIFAC